MNKQLKYLDFHKGYYATLKCKVCGELIFETFEEQEFEENKTVTLQCDRCFSTFKRKVKEV